jgi:hypothetical protein
MAAGRAGRRPWRQAWANPRGRLEEMISRRFICRRLMMKIPRASALWAIAILLPVAALATANRKGNEATAQWATSPAAVGPVLPGQCSPHYQRLLRRQIEALNRLKRLARTEGERLCAALEAADQRPIAKLLDPKSLEPLLTQRQREVLLALGIDLAKVDVAKLMRLLGVDPRPLDLQRLREQCRRSQDGLDRFASEELAKLEPGFMRCDDRV